MTFRNDKYMNICVRVNRPVNIGVIISNHALAYKSSGKNIVMLLI